MAPYEKSAKRSSITIIFSGSLSPRPNNPKTQFPSTLFIKVTDGQNLEKLFPIMVSPVRWLYTMLFSTAQAGLWLRLSGPPSPTTSRFFRRCSYFPTNDCEEGVCLKALSPVFRLVLFLVARPTMRDPARKYLPGNLSPSKDSLHLNVGQHFKWRGGGGETRSPFIWYSGSSSRFSKSRCLLRPPREALF